MADTTLTIREIFKAKAVTDEQVNAAVEAYLAGEADAYPIADGYSLDLAAAVAGHGWASAVVANPESSPGLKRGGGPDGDPVGAGAEDVTDPDAEVWRHTFEPGPDFSLSIRGQIIGRALRIDTMPAETAARWFWSITCVRQFVGLTKPSKTDSGFCHTKQEAVDALRAAWALERDWRAEVRAITPYHDAGFPRFAAMAAWETYERPATAEMPVLRDLGHELGLDAMKPWEIYQAVCREIEPNEANRDERVAEAQRRLIAVADSEEERLWCVVRRREAENRKPRHSEPGGADAFKM